MKNKKIFLYFIFCIFILRLVSAEMIQSQLYFYDWEDSGGASDYTATGSWSRTQDTAESGTWSADYDSSSSGEEYTYLQGWSPGTGYTSCFLQVRARIETGMDDGECVCLDYSNDGGSTFVNDFANNGCANTGSADLTDMCLDGDEDTENDWFTLSYNYTTILAGTNISWQFYGDAGNNEDGFVDDINLTCYAEVPDWVSNINGTPNPLSQYSNITFNASGTYNSNYYMIVCNSNSLTDAKCDGTMLCNSSAVASGSEVSCQYNVTVPSSFQVYGFLCGVNNQCTTSTNMLLCVDTCGDGQRTPYPATNPFGAEEGWTFDDAVTSAISKTDGTKTGCEYSEDTFLSSGKSYYCDGTANNHFDSNWQNFSSHDAMTITFWYKPGTIADSSGYFGNWNDEGGGYLVFSADIDHASIGAQMLVADGSAHNDIRYADTAARNKLYLVDGWRLIAFVHEAGTGGEKIHIYYNGSNEVGYWSFADESISDNDALYDLWFLARNNGGAEGQSMEGYIDDLYVFKRVLSVGELQTIFYGNYSGGEEDSCTYTSGDWNVDCSDDCVISSGVDLDGNAITVIGTGTFTIEADITNPSSILLKGTDSSNRCIVHCNGGCFK